MVTAIVMNGNFNDTGIAAQNIAVYIKLNNEWDVETVVKAQIANPVDAKAMADAAQAGATG
jgi:hypothetical protein